METLQLRLVGLAPGLLTHSPASMGDGGSKRGSHIPSPEEEAELGTYRLPDGTCAVPGIAIRNAIVKAAGAWKAARGRGTMKGSISHLLVQDDLLPLLDPDNGSPISTYEVDIRRAVVQRAAVLRARPLFRRWSLVAPVLYDEELIVPDIIRAIAADAGSRIGIGDYRPERGGPFGRFVVQE